MGIEHVVIVGDCELAIRVATGLAKLGAFNGVDLVVDLNNKTPGVLPDQRSFLIGNVPGAIEDHFTRAFRNDDKLLGKIVYEIYNKVRG